MSVQRRGRMLRFLLRRGSVLGTDVSSHEHDAALEGHRRFFRRLDAGQWTLGQQLLPAMML